MKKIKLKKLVLQNFKGCKEHAIEFSDKTVISGANAAGKTTIMDAFMWLLFDKDSTGATKFQVRPLAVTGGLIDNVEIMVEGTLDVNGREVVLRKIQKQIWRKKRGTDKPKFEGNENLFEIDGYPKLEKDYKEYVSDLMEERMFRMITNPRAFLALPWKEQRSELMCLADDVSDVDIAKSDPRFTKLVPELERVGTDDIRKKYTKALNTWKKKQEEIPARIDEVSRQIIDIDVAEKELQANALREQIEDAERQYEDSRGDLEEHDRMSSELSRIKGEMQVISDKAIRLLEEERRSIQERKDTAQRGFDKSRHQIRMCETGIKRIRAALERNEAEKKRLQDEWRAEKSKAFPEYKELPALDENSLICPTCGQKLPENLKQEKLVNYEERKKRHLEDYEKSKETFETAKKERLAQINERGNEVVADIKRDEAELKRLEYELDQAKKDSMKFNKEESEAMEKLNHFPTEPDLSDNQEYEALQLQYSKLEEELENMDSGADYRDRIKLRLSGLREELSIIEKEITSADNTAAEARITELRAEQREVGQKVADQEKMLDVLDEFVRAKMDKVSETINARFDTVSWKLFDMQINGGMKETCECMVKGVPYSSLNNGHQIIAGLDIISSLSDLHGAIAPIFIDNAETLNDFNIPAMDGQMILLKVSDDAELRVEVNV